MCVYVYVTLLVLGGACGGWELELDIFLLFSTLVLRGFC